MIFGGNKIPIDLRFNLGTSPSFIGDFGFDELTGVVLTSPALGVDVA